MLPRARVSRFRVRASRVRVLAKGECPGGRDLAQSQGAALLDADRVTRAQWEPALGPLEPG